MRQERRSPRRMCIGKVKLSWKVQGVDITEWGMIEDKSEGGLGITVPKPLLRDTVITLIQGFSSALCIVRHCSKSKQQYFVGLELCPQKTSQATTSSASVASSGQELHGNNADVSDGRAQEASGSRNDRPDLAGSKASRKWE